MAVDKGIVLAKLEAKFKGKSLTKNFKDNLATKWAARIEKDEDIDGFIDDREEDILEASNEADRRATQAAKKAKEEAAKAISGNGDADEDKDPSKMQVPDDTPAYMKAFLKQFEALSNTVTTMQQEKQATTIAERFKSDPRLKGVPEFLLKRAIPTKEEDFESSVTDLAKEYGDFATQNKLSAFGADTPVVATGTTRLSQSGSEKPDDAVANFAKAKNEKFLQEQSKN